MQRKTPLKAKSSLTAKSSLKASTKKRAKPTISKLKKRADAVFSQYIRLRDGDICITCRESGKTLQCGHFMSRRYNNTRFNEENCNAQCYRCNVLFYGEQYRYAQEIDLKYGAGTAKKLQALALEPHPFTVEELQQIIDECKEQISDYENRH